jgi:hypothetical protein
MNDMMEGTWSAVLDASHGGHHPQLESILAFKPIASYCKNVIVLVIIFFFLLSFKLLTGPSLTSSKFPIASNFNLLKS